MSKCWLIGDHSNSGTGIGRTAVYRSFSLAAIGLTFLCLSSCTTPTLVQIARRRLAGPGAKDDVTVQYYVTDWDVLNFTDEVKRKLANRSSFHMAVRYGSAGTQATLGALAGAAKTFGWATGTASGFGLAATYVFGMGQIFDSKGHAVAYEQAFTAIQVAEASYYFHQVGMGFKEDPKNPGKFLVDYSGVERADSSRIPSRDQLTPDGETLYYKVTKNLKVLNDVLAGKIPELQDLKDSKGDTSSTTAPVLRPGAPSYSTTGRQTLASPSASITSTVKTMRNAQLFEGMT